MDTQTTSLVIGVVLPPVIDVVTAKVTNTKFRFLIALAISLIVGAFVSLPKINVGDINGALGSIALVFTASQSVFTLYWEKSLMREKLNQRLTPQVSVPSGEPVQGTDAASPAETQPAA